MGSVHIPENIWVDNCNIFINYLWAEIEGEAVTRVAMAKSNARGDHNLLFPFWFLGNGTTSHVVEACHCVGGLGGWGSQHSDGFQDLANWAWAAGWNRGRTCHWGQDGGLWGSWACGLAGVVDGEAGLTTHSSCQLHSIRWCLPSSGCACAQRATIFPVGHVFHIDGFLLSSAYIGGTSIVVAFVIHHSKVSLRINSSSPPLSVCLRLETWNISWARFSPALSRSLSVFERAVTWSISCLWEQQTCLTQRSTLSNQVFWHYVDNFHWS